MMQKLAPFSPPDNGSLLEEHPIGRNPAEVRRPDKRVRVLEDDGVENLGLGVRRGRREERWDGQ